VRRVYDVETLEFGPLYIIPKPFDSRVLTTVAPAVARAAIESGVARIQLDIDEYRDALERRLGKSQEILRMIVHKAQRHPKRVVFPEGDQDKILRAAQILVDEHIAHPVLLGNEQRIRARAEELHLRLDEAVEVIDPVHSPHWDAYLKEYLRLRARKGVTMSEAPRAMSARTRFAAMMVHLGDADALIAGITQHYPDTIRPAIELIPRRAGVDRVAGMYMIITPKGQVYFLTDATVNIEPTDEALADIALLAADTVTAFDIKPRVAMMSFSSFGSSRHPLAEKVRRATELVHKRRPDLICEGEIMADLAVTPELMSDYPFSQIQGDANVLIAPSLEAGNVAYKLLMRLGGCEAIGPILMGFSRPVHVLQRGAQVNDIVSMTALAVVEAQRRAKH